jgi:hypothetical protein
MLCNVSGKFDTHCLAAMSGRRCLMTVQNFGHNRRVVAIGGAPRTLTDELSMSVCGGEPA